MRIVRERMLCIISPQWPGGAAALSPNIQDAMRRLCQDIGVVHFATLALLPARPGEPKGALPSLMLELALDEGVRPDELLAQMVYHPGEALWAIYQAYWPLVQPASTGARNEALLQRLKRELSLADGAFVGPRDRTVAQTRQEHALYVATRTQAQTVSAKLKSERASFALALARWMLGTPQFEWAASPAPRSYWRRAGSAAKAAYLGLVVVAVPALLWLALQLLQLVHAVGARWGGAWPAWLKRPVSVAVGTGSDGIYYLLGASVRALGVLLAAVLLLAFFFVLLPAVMRPWKEWLKAVRRELDRPTQTWSSRSTYLLGWYFLAALVAGLLAALVVVAGGYGSLGKLIRWLHDGRSAWVAWLLCAYAVSYAVLFAVLWIGLPRSSNTAPYPGKKGSLSETLYELRRKFRRPLEEEVPRAQQIHPSIEACEARLVGGTAHMISLTELRWPFFWSAWLTRRILRAVTFLGHLLFTEGRLGDAPGIHFGHWHILDGGRRFLFCANFDGTFGGYLDDFINGPCEGTTLFWRKTRLLVRPAAVAGHPAVEHARDFPPTRFALFRGVKCELTFKAYARDSMLPHLFRFDALGLSLDEKIRATQLRDALCGERTDAKDDLIMRLIES